MSNINFFRVLQNATPQDGEYNFNYVASGSAFISGNNCGVRGYYNSQPGEGTPLSFACDQIWQSYQSSSIRLDNNNAAKLRWITASANFYNTSSAGVNKKIRIFSNGKNSGRLQNNAAPAVDTLDNAFFTIITGPDKLGGAAAAITGTATSLINVDTGHSNPNIFNITGDYENKGVEKATTSSLAYFGAVSSGFIADFQYDNITFKTASVWLSSGSVGGSSTEMTIRQHYTTKPNNPTEIFRSNQVAGDDYKDFILDTAGANIPNGLNFTNDGFGCVFVYGDGANSYTTVVSMSTAYGLDTMFKSSSITNITPALTAATTTSGDYTQLCDTFMFRDDGGVSWANDKMVLIQYDLGNNNTTTSWVPIIDNNTQGIEYIGRANPGTRIPGYTQPNCQSNQLLGRFWSKPIQWYRDGQSGFGFNSINNQMYCVDQLSGGGELNHFLHLFALIPKLEAECACV